MWDVGLVVEGWLDWRSLGGRDEPASGTRWQCAGGAVAEGLRRKSVAGVQVRMRAAQFTILSPLGQPLVVERWLEWRRCHEVSMPPSAPPGEDIFTCFRNLRCVTVGYIYLLPQPEGAARVDPRVVGRLLQPLVHPSGLNFYSFGRDTPKGKDTMCVMLHTSATSGVRLFSICPRSWLPVARTLRFARDLHAVLPDGVPVLCIELVANRFLRRQVRVLVATAVRSALCLQSCTTEEHPSESVTDKALTNSDAAGMDTLLRFTETEDRQVTAWPAPASGLCFAGVGYPDEHS
ncbi:hypothetical protein CYMTET_50943 [Cymbomonas tetramitiformis]|uniref:Uncharacterized protein n=1 Tax=Cymbomonas tetramitiformis TaxID=36881 RepID=A0AAE0ESN0_9CHLO|nr:hypothetical protein CYMTET_50943 [Cymbomonas tetramitiformis]